MKNLKTLLLLISSVFLSISCSNSKLLIKADKKFAKGKYEKAEKKYRKVFRKDSKNGESAIGIGNCRFYYLDYKNAIKYYEMALKKGNFKYYHCNNQKEIFQLGESYFKLGNYASALPYFSYLSNSCTILTIKNSTLRAGVCSYYLGKDLFMKEDFVKALKYFKKAETFFVKKEPSAMLKDSLNQLFGETYLIIAERKYQLKDYIVAENNWMYIKKYNSDLSKSPKSQFLIGNIYNRLGEYKKAFEVLSLLRKDYSTVINGDSLASELSIAAYSLSKMKFSESRPSKSLEYLIIAEKENPEIAKSVEAILLKGNCLYQLRKYEDALKEYNKVHKLNKIDFSLYKREMGESEYFVGKALFDLQQHANALELFKNSVTKLNSSSRIYSQALNYAGLSLANMADSLFAEGKYQQALDYYFKSKRNLRQSNRSYMGSYKLSEIYFRTGQLYEFIQMPELAVTQYDTILTYYPNTNFYHESCEKGLELAEQLQQFEKAINFSKALIELHTEEPEIADNYIFRTARFYVQTKNIESSFELLFRLYESQNYEVYRILAENDGVFNSLSNDERYKRWVNGIRRIKLLIDSASSDDFDQWGTQNDLTVIILDSDGQLLLSTENVEDDNRPIFWYNEVIFDYKVGDLVGFLLMENDHPNEPETYIYKFNELSFGEDVISSYGNFGYGKWEARINYHIEDTYIRPRSDNLLVPQGVLSGNREIICFWSCLAQSILGEFTNSAELTGLISELINSYTNNTKYSWKNGVKETLLNYISNGLRESGYDDAADKLEISRFFDCYYGCVGQ